MSIKYMTLACAIFFATCTTLGFKFQNVDDQKVPVKPVVSIAAKAKAPASKSTAKPRAVSERERISQFVYTVRPKLGRKHADRVAAAIVTSARRNNLPATMVATTAYIESEFRMVSAGGSVGIMQIMPATAHKVFGKSNLKLNDLEDNIEMGSRYLALHYVKYTQKYSAQSRTLSSRSGSSASRGNYVRSSRTGSQRLTASQQLFAMRRAWGRYNGSGVNGPYQRKATKVLKRMTEWTPAEWANHVKSKGSLWKR